MSTVTETTFFLPLLTALRQKLKRTEIQITN